MKPSSLLRPALEGFRRSLGPDHLDTRTTSSLLDILLLERAPLAAKEPEAQAGVPKSPQIAPPTDR